MPPPDPPPSPVFGRPGKFPPLPIAGGIGGAGVRGAELAVGRGGDSVGMTVGTAVLGTIAATSGRSGMYWSTRWATR